jgi:hypothetical protein
MLSEKIRVLLTCCLLGGLIAGCKSEAAKNEEKIVQTLFDLMMLQSIIHNYHDIENRFPGSWEEASEFATKREMSNGIRVFDPSALDRLRSLGYSVAWGKSIRDIGYGAVATCTGNFTLTNDGIDSPDSWPYGWFPTNETKKILRDGMHKNDYRALNFGD